MAMSQTVELPRLGGPGTGLGGSWRVIVRNDDHNTFDHVARTLARFIPGVSVERGMEIANVIHSAGGRSSSAATRRPPSTTGSS